MDEKELFKILKEAEMPVAYYHWENPPELPYLVYLFTDSENFGADNKTYQKINDFQVELYSDKKDTASEQKLEAVFDLHELFYDKSEVYIETEKLYEVIYTITI